MVSEVQSIMIMAANRQTWYWRRSSEFYIWIHRQQEKNCVSLRLG